MKTCGAYTKFGHRCKNPIAKGNTKYCGYHSDSKNRKNSKKVQEKITKREARDILSKRLAKSRISVLKDISQRSKLVFDKPNKLWGESKGKHGDVRDLDDGTIGLLDKYNFSQKDMMILVRKYKRKSKNKQTDKEIWGFSYRTDIDDYRPAGLEKPERTKMKNKIIERINKDYSDVDKIHKTLFDRMKKSLLSKQDKDKFVKIIKIGIDRCLKAKDKLILHIRKYYPVKNVLDLNIIYEGYKIILMDNIKYIHRDIDEVNLKNRVKRKRIRSLKRYKEELKSVNKLIKEKGTASYESEYRKPELEYKINEIEKELKK